VAYDLTTFFVVPNLPGPLQDLDKIAGNLWWSWNRDAIDLFRRMDATLWQRSGHNPVQMLGMIEQRRLEELASDDAFLSHLRRVMDRLSEHLSQRSWYQRIAREREGLVVAYFCAEFGITESLHIYSGGLGVLAGDHLQSSSELGFPLIGVGLMYREGYFRQTLTADGWQQEQYPVNDLPNMPVKRVARPDGTPFTVSVNCPHAVQVQAWKVQIGRTPLYLLTTDVDGNAPADRTITGRLYSGDQEMRLRQEIVLGVGGMRFLTEIGAGATVCHLNEGHSVFSVLERIRQIREATGLPFDAAREVASSGTVFTTHTPVAAGHDEFALDLIDRYFSPMYAALGLDRATFLGLGQKTPGSQTERFSLTVLALRLAAAANGVSRLHGQVARSMWTVLWPEAVVDEVPIGHITNGIHTRSWISRDLAELYDHYLGPRWSSNPEDTQVWRAIQGVPDDELWRVHERRRERLVAFVRGRVAEQVEHRRGSVRELESVRDLLDPRVLTIGFARRFATYKRAGLIMADMERLERMLNDAHRPVQLVFAGKAHPQDDEGKKLIQKIYSLCRNEATRRRVVFLQDYSIEVARYMAQGVDVWLNTPRRPQEASGTSGMKAAANGGLNCSILDGWWAEAYAGPNGWAIGNGEVAGDPAAQDELEARSLFAVLEEEIIPLFYQRGRDGIPHDWVRRMKASIESIGPVFNTARMVVDYAQKYYFPLHDRYRELVSADHRKAREIAAFRQRLRAEWAAVRIQSIATTASREVRVGDQIQVDAAVHLGRLAPPEVRVELVHGIVAPDGGFVAPERIRMELAETGTGAAGGTLTYRGLAPCRRTGQNGVAVRVLPEHDGMIPAQVLSRVVWHRR
jgi:starch phosphorylase